MKIVGIETIPLRVQLAQPTWSATAVTSPSAAPSAAVRTALLVRVLTDEGLVGIGQSYTTPSTLLTVRSAVVETVKPYLIGQDPFFVEGLWDTIYRGTFQSGRKGVVIAALSGVDIALWDIIGKAAGKPVYRLLGATRSRVLGYASGGFYSPGKTTADLEEEMAGYAARGFRAAKLKIGWMSIKDDLERMRSARQAVGDDFRLMADANRVYDPKTAIRMARRMEELDYDWLEEPVSPDDVAGSAAVVAASPIPIAGYETENTAVGYRELIARRAVDIVQPDVIWSGGFTESRRIASLAHVWGLPMAVHAWSSAIALVAGLHLAGSAPNATLVEMDQTPNPLVDELLTETVEIDAEGQVAVPESPGLGVELNEATVRRFRVDV